MARETIGYVRSIGGYSLLIATIILAATQLVRWWNEIEQQYQAELKAKKG